MSLTVRPVAPQDNPHLFALVRDVLTEHGCVGEGFAFADPELKQMYETYQAPGSAYWVVVDEETGRVLGGGGYSRLKGTTEAEGICELQKLYFYDELRGKGFGRKLLELSIEAATRDGYRVMYLETVHQMKNAQGLYARFGFVPLEGPMGATGHHNCTVFMKRPLVETPAPLPA